MNTISMLGQAYSLLGFRIVEGVVGTGHPQKPSWSAVFAQIGPEGSRLVDLAAKANMTPQSMQQIVDEMEAAGYLERRRHPTDRRAKLIVLTAEGRATVADGEAVIAGLEEDLVGVLGQADYAELRRILDTILRSVPTSP